MKHISDLLSVDRINVDADVHSKKKALEKLASLLSDEQIDQDDILAAMIAREKVGSTGLGDNVAIPHCRVANCSAPRTALLTLREAIDFDALDGDNVDILWALIVPENATQEHLDLLAVIAGYLGDAQGREAIRGCEDAQQLYQWLDENGNIL